MADEGPDDDLEFTLMNKKEALVYQIPPASSSSGHKADDWKKCIWRGRCRIIGKGQNMSIKMIDASSGNLFAQCMIPGGEHTKYVEPVKDSSRYFVLKITNGERHAFIGLGFEDRNDAFDFKCALDDFKSTYAERKADASGVSGPSKIGPAKDLSLKEGQKISLNLKNIVPGAKKRASEPQGGGGGIGLLAPPPPGGGSRQAPTGAGYAAPKAAPAPMPAFSAPAASTPAPAADDFFADFDDFQSAGPAPVPAAPAPAADFAAFCTAPAPAADFAAFQTAPMASHAAPQSADPLAALSGISFNAAPPAAAPTPPLAFAPAAAPVMAAAPAAAPAAAAPKEDLDPFALAFGSAAASLSTPALAPKPKAAPTAQGAKKDPFDDFDIFK